MRLAFAFMASAVLAAGCGGGEEEAAPPLTGTTEPGPSTTEPESTTTEPGPTTTESEPTNTGETANAQSCTNDPAGYSLSYPAGWSTNTGDVVPPCRFFDPEPFTLEPDTEAPSLAASVRVAPIAYDRLLEEDRAGRVLSEGQAQVAGRDATVTEIESTGQGLLPEGARSYTYYVDLGEETLVAVTSSGRGLDYQANKAALDEMVATLELSR